MHLWKKKRQIRFYLARFVAFLVVLRFGDFFSYIFSASTFFLIIKIQPTCKLPDCVSPKAGKAFFFLGVFVLELCIVLRRRRFWPRGSFFSAYKATLINILVSSFFAGVIRGSDVGFFFLMCTFFFLLLSAGEYVYRIFSFIIIFFSPRTKGVPRMWVYTSHGETIRTRHLNRIPYWELLFQV